MSAVAEIWIGTRPYEHAELEMQEYAVVSENGLIEFIESDRTNFPECSREARGKKEKYFCSPCSSLFNTARKINLRLGIGENRRLYRIVLGQVHSEKNVFDYDGKLANPIPVSHGSPEAIAYFLHALEISRSQLENQAAAKRPFAGEGI